MPWEQGNGFRSAPLPSPPPGKTGFTLLPSSRTGIAFTNQLSDAKAAENQIRINGSGVALGDVDGDGSCDIYLCRLEGPNALYRNLGNWKFEEITASSGAACADQYSTGAVLADLDGDGDLDLLVNGIGVGTRLFLNDGHGKFTEATNSGLSRKFGATTLALADIDGDGDLDLYVANYRTTTIRTTGMAVLNLGGKRMIRPEDRDYLEFTPEGRVLEHGEPDFLYRNDGHGHFTPLSWTDGTFLDEDGQPLAKAPFDWGLSAMFRDLNGDGAPDLYVCNDFHSTDKIWINDGHGRFRAAPRLALRHTSTFSMAVDFGDLNRDGFDDIFVADMSSLRHARRLLQAAGADTYVRMPGIFEDRPQADRNTLQLSRGDGTFADIGYYAGLDASDWTWSGILLDVDLDGYEDLLCSTGQMFDTQDLDAAARIQAKGPWPRDLIPQKLLMFPKMPQPKMAFRNRGDLTFEEVSKTWGFDQVGVGHGMALADLDNDGDLDLVVNNLNDSVGIYRNDCSAPRLAVRLEGLAPNTRGIGARIKVFGGPVEQSQEMIAGGRYLSGDDALRLFAAGSATNLLRIEVTWRNGKRSVVPEARANRLYEVAEAGAEAQSATIEDRSAARAAPPAATTARSEQHARSEIDASARNAPAPGHPRPLFEDVSNGLNHSHLDEPFDDFARQPLLPKKLSQLGPGVAWFDLDGDGWDDLMIGGGKGGQLAVYRNDRRGSFQRFDQAPFNQTLARDQTGIVGWRKTMESGVLLAGSANYEDGLEAGACARQYGWGAARVDDNLPGEPSSSGPLALADVDGDGALELFVGGRCLPGRWPEPATSVLFRQRDGRFEFDPLASGAFARVGLVSGAVFTDLNGDGAPDLVLACEWGPLRVFINEGGRFSEVTRRLGLDRFVGWWNGVTAGDFDGDGRLDLAASNWGLNSSHQNAHEARVALARLAGGSREGSGFHPPLLYYGDFDGNGVLDLIEARFDPELNKIVPDRSFTALAQALPLAGERFKTFASFDEAGVGEIMGGALKEGKPLEATWLASTVFLNRGDHFEAVLLPPAAQFSPAFGIIATDFDGDGNEDIFLSQNFFPLEPTSARLDSGRGLLLRGDGRGGFTIASGQESGVLVYGEGRGAAAGDYDRDGRIDLVAAQNGAQTKLYHNVGAKPGLRVRLKGGAGNPDGIGAVLRLAFGGRWGPAREIHAGSGYWSQDSALEVMATPEAPTQLQVRWPGGKTTTTNIPAGTKEIEVDRKN